MNKRITSLLLCFVMIFSMLATAVPAFAAGSTSFEITADKTEVSPGDTITYTVTMGAVSRLDSLKFKLVIPEGLTIVSKSGTLTAGLKDTLNCVETSWTESTKVFYATNCGDSEGIVYGYSSADPTEIMTLQCTVDTDASGSLTIDFNINPNDCYNPDYENISFTTTPATVTVRAAASFGGTVAITGTKYVSEPLTADITGLTGYGDESNLSYSWKHREDGAPLIGNGGKTFTPTSSGEYRVEVSCNGTTVDSDWVMVTARPAAHTHSWASTWTTDGTHHWHECTASGCDITDNSQKDGYTTHVYDQQTTNYKASDATCTSKATYYTSCVCGAKGTATFESGELASHNITHHAAVPATCTATGTIEYWSCSSCNRKYSDAAATSPIEGVTTPKNLSNHTGTKELKKDGTQHWYVWSCCNAIDGAKQNHSGGTATCIGQATCSTCHVWYGEKDPTNHALPGTQPGYSATQHWTEHECCGQVVGAKQAHTYDNDTDTSCNGCAYVRTITHTCGASTLTAIAKVDATHFVEGKEAHYKCSCGKYYEDNTALVPINDIETWGVISKTDHQLSVWMHDEPNTKHWKECTISGCTHKEQEDAHAGGTASCQAKAECATCGESYGEFGAHDYDTTWGYKEANGHAHCCKTTGCTAHDTVVLHIPGAAATEEAAQTCTECGYELAAKLEHAPMLVEGYEATTEAPGKKDYYHCDSCGKNYADVTSMIEIEGDPEEWRYIPMIIAIIEGNGQVWTKGTTVDLTFKSNANFADFTRVEVDGAKVDASNYTKSEGSTIVTLKASFLETLSVGEHTIVIVSANDVPEAKFTVKASATGGNTGNEQNPDTGATSPQTGDNSNMLLRIALLFVSLGGLTTTVVYKKRKTIKE